ncbi:hypothetical protein FDC62_04500 [Clostridium botulinum]|uniref:TolB family protein n=1 Tax=Clostridium botulinum TaxID=1491 RepID=UPI00052D9A13|nr:PD40 domain-containing protein [Clostridium botulinum]KGM95397.1 hypothetical protein Z956_04810 [Clostridium botulinum D str. CCUG 7971]KOC46312.1 hypothetical protein ADU88_12215 [Clostridium botulinum]NFO97482.1 hypothetical protein [Clostridium botulinum]OOV51412.1 hypothetical protein B1A66_09300 [Clostridium botulinum D/C]OOV58605.1 hypothetical protein B0673_01990 [Clostridium botulinum D/C]
MKEILIAKIAVPTLIIGGLIGVSYFGESYATDVSDNPIVVSEKVVEANNIDNKPLQIVQRWQSKNIPGLSGLWDVNSKDEVIAGIGLSKGEFEKKNKDKKIQEGDSRKQSEEVFDDLYGNLYKLNLKSQKQSLLKCEGGYIQSKDICGGLSQDGKYISYTKNDKMYVCNLLNGKEIMINKKMNTTWSEDGKYLIGCIENQIYLYNIKNNTTKTIKINKIDENKLYVQPYMYSEDGKEIYFIGEQVQKDNNSMRRNCIFKVNVETNKTEEVLSMPYNKTTGRSSEENDIPLGGQVEILDGGKKIILNVTIKGKSGLYMYDVQDKKFYTLVDTIKTQAGGYAIDFSVSPDGNKIAYVNKSKENADSDKRDLYVARIDGHKLTNRINIERNIELGGFGDLLWSNDSKKIYFFKSNGDIDKNGNYVSSENYINVVTLK